MCFKHYIRICQMTAVVFNIFCWRRSRKFIITLRVSSGGIVSISCPIISFKSSRDWGRRLKTFSFTYSQCKKWQGPCRPPHHVSPLKLIPRPGNISLNTPSERRAIWAVASIAKLFFDLVQILDRARNVYETLSASLSQSGYSDNTLGGGLHGLQI